jgi:hypothetical protein
MAFSKDALDFYTSFFLGNRDRFDSMHSIDKETFINYISDCNSSSIREAVTLHYLKYQSYDSKHGFDGFDPTTGRQKEIKPRFFTDKKVSLGGNFNDLTLSLLEKKKDCDIICSSFMANDLLFIVEFPISDIYERLKIPIINAKLGKRIVCPFSYKDIINSTQVKIHFYNEEVINKTNCLTTSLARFFKERGDK